MQKKTDVVILILDKDNLKENLIMSETQAHIT